jgi:hypothetical protein
MWDEYIIDFESVMIRYGLIPGLISGSILFIPSCMWTSSLAQSYYQETLNKNLNINTDSYLIIWLCFPLALIACAFLGILGAYIGFRIKPRISAVFIGSIIGGAIGALFITGCMNLYVISDWVSS